MTGEEHLEETQIIIADYAFRAQLVRDGFPDPGMSDTVRQVVREHR